MYFKEERNRFKQLDLQNNQFFILHAPCTI